MIMAESVICSYCNKENHPHAEKCECGFVFQNYDKTKDYVDTSNKLDDTPTSTKIFRYLLVIFVCFILFIIYTMIGAMLGWRGGGGAIPMMLLFGLCIFVWRKITKSSKK